MISTPEPLKNHHSGHTPNMVAQSQQNDLQAGPQGCPESIKNRQKSRSGLQGVRLGVLSEPGSANWHQNAGPRPQKWSPQASKMPGLASKMPVNQSQRLQRLDASTPNPKKYPLAMLPTKATIHRIPDFQNTSM